MLQYWLLFPLAFGALLLGLGLGVRRLSVPFPAPLLLPVGYSAAMVVASLLCLSPETPAFAGPVLIVLSLAGWIAGYKPLIAPGALRRQLPWIVAGLAAFLAFGLSAIAAGFPTFTGASQTVDIAHQFDFSWYAGEYGRAPLEYGRSSALNVAFGGLPLYPWGPQSVLGTFPGTIGMEIPWSWQPMLAILAGSIVASAYALMLQVTDRRRFAAVGAFAAGQASALLSYGQIAGIKELASAGVLMAAAALTLELRRTDQPAWRVSLPFTVAAAGAFSIFSITLAPWLAILTLGGLAVVWRTETPRAALMRLAWIAGAGAVVSFPTILLAFQSLDYVDQMGAADEVGNLAHPLSLWAGTGIWLTDDYRFALGGLARTISIVLGLGTLALAGYGFVAAARRRLYPVVWLSVAAGITFVFLVARMGPWVELKGIVLASPVVLVLAVIGLSTAFDQPRPELRRASWAAVAVLVLAGLWAGGARFGSAQLASQERYQELEAINDQYAGAAGALHPDYDEQAEFRLRDVRGAAPFNFPFFPSDSLTARMTATGKPAPQQWDLDDIDAVFVGQFELVVARRAPAISRPPQNYALIQQGRFYDVWKRQTPLPAKPGFSHTPFDGAADPQSQRKCQAYVDGLAAGTTVTIAPTTVPLSATFVRASLPARWGVDATGTVVSPDGAATANGTVTVPRDGRYEVYLTTNSKRRVTLSVDGRALPSPQQDRTYVLRPRLAGVVSLRAGAVKVGLSQADGRFTPGGNARTSTGTVLGPVTLVPAGTLHPALIKAPATEATCPPSPDWVETP